MPWEPAVSLIAMCTVLDQGEEGSSSFVDLSLRPWSRRRAVPLKGHSFLD